MQLGPLHQGPRIGNTMQATATKPTKGNKPQATAPAPQATAPAPQATAPAPQAAAPAPQATAPYAHPATHAQGGIPNWVLPANLRAKAAGSFTCPPKYAGVLLAVAPNAKPPRAQHVALWVQAAHAAIAAAGGRATGAACCAPQQLPVPATTAQALGLLAAPTAGTYWVSCPGHVVTYTMGSQLVPYKG